MNVKLVKGYWFGSLVLMFWFPVCHYRMSEQWYSASEELDSESDSDQEERLGPGQCLGEGGRSDQVTAPSRWEDIPYVGEGNPGMRSFVWENPLQMSGIGRGLSSAEVMRHATSSYSRLVRRVAARESSVTESKVSVMAAKASRPEREEESSDDDSKVSVGSFKEPVVFRGRSRSREACSVATSGMAHISRPSGDVEFPPGRRDYRESVPGAWLWYVDPEIEGPCLQGSPVPVFPGSSQGNGRGQSCVPSAG